MNALAFEDFRNFELLFPIKAALLAMIPRKIHYVWFGGKPKPKLILDTIESWRRFLPDYEMVGWDEGNFDTGIHPWMERMIRSGKFAFASDWARLHILHQHGGIYLDTDVEIKKPLDPFLETGMFWGFEYDCYLATCIIGSRPGHPLLMELLEEYDGLEGAPINNALVTRFFLKRFPGFRLNNCDQTLPDDVHVYGKEYFSIPSSDRAKNFARHHGSNLWRSSEKDASKVKSAIRRLMGEENYYKLICYKVCRVNEFYPIYKSHRKLK